MMHETRPTVMQVVGPMNRGGAETMLMNLFRELAGEFRFVFLVHTHKGTRPVGDFDAEIQARAGLIRYVDAVWQVGFPAYVRQFRDVVEDLGGIDVVHSHLNSKGGTAAAAATISGVPRKIVHSHASLQFDGPMLPRVAAQVELALQKRLIARFATDYWACSPEAARSLFLPSLLASPHALIVKNAFDVNQYLDVPAPCTRADLGVSPEEAVLGSLGRVAPVKGYHFAADVLRRLRDRGIPFHYFVAGGLQYPDYAHEVKLAVRQAGLSDRVTFLGQLEEPERFYPVLDVFLGLSIREGLGLAAVEAQAAGRHCVLSDGFPRSCDLGLGLVEFLPQGDADSWAAGVERAIGAQSEVPTVEERRSALSHAGYDVKAGAAAVARLYLRGAND